MFLEALKEIPQRLFLSLFCILCVSSMLPFELQNEKNTKYIKVLQNNAEM